MMATLMRMRWRAARSLLILGTIILVMRLMTVNMLVLRRRTHFDAGD